MVKAIENRLMLNRALWYGLIGLGAIWAGYLLASAPVLLMLVFGGLAWLLTLPYHAKLSAIVAVSTFGSALIVPFFPGRPYMWEFAALLAWSGLVVVVCMRRHASDCMDQVREHRWLFVSAFGYFLVLIVTMHYRGFGLRIFGGEQMGGRFYFQQLVCAIFPTLFVMVRFEEKTLVRLFTLQCLLAATFLISDFALSIAPQRFLAFLYFFELGSDAVNFQMHSMVTGMRRIQSFGTIAQGLSFALMIRFSLKDFIGRRAVWLLPLALAALAVGLPSGTRLVSVIVGLTWAFSAYAQRFYSIKSIMMTIAVVGMVVPAVYVFGNRLPLAAQRAISFLPGIDISEEARIDGSMTLGMRRELREVGFELMPLYFWIGRGFGQSSYDYSSIWDPTGLTSHIRMGRFYNGFIGLMVNTGVFGTACMLMFLAAGTVLAWKIMRLLRTQGCEDSFARTCSVLSGLWMANVFVFLLLHGDSEWAMKTFSLQAGLLLACHDKLKRRASVRKET